jgi:hypothetical protein
MTPCYAALQHLQGAHEKIRRAQSAATVHSAPMRAAPTFTARTGGA